MDYTKDYYKILQVKESASSYEIKKAFHRLAKIYHPDVNKQDQNAESIFKQINEAYMVLSNEETRKQYDFYYKKYHNNSRYDYSFNYRTYQQKQTYDEPKQQKKQQKTKVKKEKKPKVSKNIELNVEITYKELYFASTKTIQYVQSIYNPLTKTWSQKMNYVSFDVPININEVLVFSNKGNQSNRGHFKFGKLTLHFKLKPSNLFYLDENQTLHQKFIIDMLSAITGTTIDFLTPSKKMQKIIIPPNTSNQSKMILEHAGLYLDKTKKTRGDLVIEIIYDNLQHFRADELKLLKQLAKIHDAKSSLMTYYYELNKELDE